MSIEQTPVSQDQKLADLIASARSDAPPPQAEKAEPAAEPSSGAKLKQARLDAGLEIKTISARLHIKQEQLEALENDDYEPFPAVAYALGFLRAYAKHLGVDVSTEIARLKKQNEQTRASSSIEFPEAPDQPIQLPWKGIFGVILLAAIGAGAWSFFTQPTEQAARPAPHETADAAAPTPLGADEPADYADMMATNNPALEAEQPRAMGDTALAATTPDYEIAEGADQTAEAALANETPDTPLNESELATMAPGQSGIQLMALQDCWIQIKDSGGRIVKTGILAEGENYTVPEGEGLTLIAGNAGGLAVQIGDTMLGALGRSGQVINKELALSEQSLRTATSRATR